MTLNVAFEKYLGNELKKYGFVKTKNRHPYYVRIIKSEIVHVISFMSEPPEKKGYNLFTILSGIATIYRPKIIFSIAPKENRDWLWKIDQVYVKSNPYSFDPNYRKEACHFSFEKGNENSMINALNDALIKIEHIVLPVLNEVDSIESCLYYYNIFCHSMHLYDYNEGFGKMSNMYESNESFLKVLCRNYDVVLRETMDYNKRLFEYHVKNNIPGHTQELYERYYADIAPKINDEMNYRNRFIYDEFLHNKFTEELNIRIKKNIEHLVSLGLEINQSDLYEKGIIL